MAADDPAASVGRGRPKSAQLDEAIVEAACAILAEQGYSGFSFDAVAKVSGTTRPAIYRRWTRREDLLLAALDHVMHVHPAPGEELPSMEQLQAMDNPTLLSMLRHLTANLVRILSDRRANAVAISVSAAAYGDGEVRQSVQAHHYDRRKPLEDIMRLAQERGLLRGDVSLDNMIHILVGAVQYRSTLLQEPITEAYANEILGVLLAPSA